MTNTQKVDDRNVQHQEDTVFLVEREGPEQPVHSVRVVETMEQEVGRWASETTCREGQTLDLVEELLPTVWVLAVQWAEGRWLVVVAEGLEDNRKEGKKVVVVAGRKICQKSCVSSAETTDTLPTCVPTRIDQAIEVDWNVELEDKLVNAIVLDLTDPQNLE